jgi:5-methoxy-6-methylbenzimidazole methyltransferase
VAESEVNRMKVLLLEHPRAICPDRCNDIANTPLSSCLLSGYVAGILKSKGHEVEIVEGYLDRLSFGEIEQRVRKFGPDILGVHLVYHWQDNLELYSFLQMVKDQGLTPYITAFGFYPTIAYKNILQKRPALDSVVIGEPEISFAELVSDSKVNPKIPGIAFRNELGTISLARRPLIKDLDIIPFPVRTPASYRLPEVNLQGSRGCYGNCTFCYINPFYGEKSRWRGRTPENIVSEIDQVIAVTGRKNFYFTDPNFFGPGELGQLRAKRLAAMLKPRQISFGIEGRVNDIHDDTIAALVDAGLRQILIGLESGRDSSLQRMNKMTTVAQNEAAIRILRKHGIEPNIGFIMFEPDATIDDLRVNLEFLKRNDLLKDLPVTANVLYHHQIVLKGTPAYRRIQQEGRLVSQGDVSYEGTAIFKEPRVADLANIMREVTNFLFTRMADIWNGKVDEPDHATEKYESINQLLVRIFEDNLLLLQLGKQLPSEQVNRIIRDIQEKMAALF